MQNVLTSIQNTYTKFGMALMALMLSVTVAFGQHEDAHAEGGHEFKPGDMIMHHISDGHQIHIIGQIYIPLPVILIHDGHVDMFSSSNFWDGFD
ncbi:MAG: hypothetical protein ACOVMR_10515, partial [Flavobacteriales bacterium]